MSVTNFKKEKEEGKRGERGRKSKSGPDGEGLMLCEGAESLSEAEGEPL